MTTKNNIFPSKIGPFTFIGKVKFRKTQDNYRFAKYRNQRNEMGICKLWYGIKKNQYHSYIKNELAVYQYLTAINWQERKKLSQKYPNIIIPKLYDFGESESTFWLLISEFKGKLVAETDSTKMLSAYQQAVAYFSDLSQIGDTRNITFISRGKYKLLLLFHFYLFRSLIRNLGIAKQIIILWKHFIIGISQAKTSHFQHFVHRDLGGYNNVLVNNNFVCIIDYQITAKTHPLVEVANLVSTRWDNQQFIQLFIASPMYRKIIKSRKKHYIFNSFIAYDIIFRLCFHAKEKSLTVLERSRIMENTDD